MQRSLFSWVLAETDEALSRGIRAVLLQDILPDCSAYFNLKLVEAPGANSQAPSALVREQRAVVELGKISSAAGMLRMSLPDTAPKSISVVRRVLWRQTHAVGVW